MSAPPFAAADFLTGRTKPRLSALIFLAGTIDMKQAKLEQACTAAHQAQIRTQLAGLISRFQKQYADWLKSGDDGI